MPIRTDKLHHCNHCKPGTQQVLGVTVGVECLYFVDCVTCAARGPLKPTQKLAWVGWCRLNGYEVRG